jgi:hypothetical protein
MQAYFQKMARQGLSLTGGDPDPSGRRAAEKNTGQKDIVCRQRLEGQYVCLFGPITIDFIEVESTGK